MCVHVTRWVKSIWKVNLCRRISKRFHYSIIFTHFETKALYYFEKSLSRDENDKDPEALYQLGLLEEKGFLSDGGKTREENRENAKAYFMAAMDKGHKDAITDLGFMAYEDGDYKAALEYYKMAKKMKHPRALNNLGKLFMENLVPEKVKVKGDHFRKAIKYFELAAEFGHVKALFNLGSLNQKYLILYAFFKTF